MRTAKSILRECFLGVIDFNEEAAIAAMKRYAKLYHESKVKKISCNPVLSDSLPIQCTEDKHIEGCRCEGRNEPNKKLANFR